MSSQEVSHDSAFSLIELLLSCSLIMIVGLFMFPLSIMFYRTQMLNETREGVQSVLLRAQDFSRTGKGGGMYGVDISEQAYTLFEGSSYATRDVSKDEVYLIPATIAVTPTEVVFEQFSGRSAEAVTIEMHIEQLSAFVAVNEHGVISTY